MLYIVSGPSGVGKTTVVNLLKERMPEIILPKSYTTRPPRVEDDGTVDDMYVYLSESAFDELYKQGAFLERAVYNNNNYGTLKADLDDVLRHGEDAFLIIELTGAQKMKKAYGKDTCLIMLEAPSLDELRRRLITRGGLTTEQIENRLQDYYTFHERVGDYDHVIMNDDLETAVNEVKAVVMTNRHNSK